MRETATDLWNPISVFGKILFSPTLNQRILATLIDLALISLLQMGAGLVFGIYQPLADATAKAVINGDGVFFSTGRATTIAFFWLAVIVVAYFTWFETLFGATPGKAMLRLHVVMLDGGRPTFGAVFLRNLLRLIDVLPFFYIVGGLVAQSTLHEQRVGDIVAGTIVVARTRPTSDGPARRLRLLLLTAIVFAALLGGSVLFQYFGRPPLIIQSWVNANNSYQAATDTVPAAAQRCGPTPQWPYPDAPGGGASRPILQYALGAPQWGDGVVTYPIRVQVWNYTTDSGQLPASPNQISMADLGAGPDVYNGHVILRWVGPLNGGWQIASGDMGCAKAP